MTCSLHDAIKGGEVGILRSFRFIETEERRPDWKIPRVRGYDPQKGFLKNLKKISQKIWGFLPTGERWKIRD